MESQRPKGVCNRRIVCQVKPTLDGARHKYGSSCVGDITNFFLRNSVHNRVENRRKLHELKIEKGTDIMEHFFEFDEMCMKMQASGESMNSVYQLIILLGSLSDDYALS